LKGGKLTIVQQIVLPIKDSNVLKMVQDTLLDSFRAGRRNYPRKTFKNWRMI